MTSQEISRRAAVSCSFAIRVRLEDWTGAFKDVDRDLRGFPFLVGARWSEDNDGQGQTGEITIKRGFFQTSASPFVSASPVNKAWGDPGTTTPQLFLDVYRRVQIDYYLAAGDEPTGGETWTNVFDGRIDKFRAADGGNIVIECRDKAVAELAERYFERERYYGLTPGTYANQKGLQIWKAGESYVVGDLVVPTTLNDRLYRVSAISGSGSSAGVAGATEPIWPTTIGVSVVSNNATFICDAVTAAAGTVTMEQVLQQMLNDSGVSYTLYAPTASSFVVNVWKQGREPIYEALRKVALLIGADVRRRWSNATPGWELTLYIPDRAPAGVMATFTPDDYRSVKQLDVDIAGIRNAGRVVYSSTTLGSDGKTPLRKFVEDNSRTASITRFGRRWFEISEDATSGVRASADATRLLNAALDDMAAPQAELSVDAYFFPWVQLGDYYVFAAHPEYFDSAQSLAVTSYAHELTVGDDGTVDLATSIACRGKPSRGYDVWHQVEARPGTAPIHDIAISGGGATVTVNATLIGGAKLYVEEKLERATKWDGYEIHISKTPGFTPGPSTLVGVARSADFEVQKLEPGATYYAKAKPRGVNAGQLIVGEATAEVSFVAGHASAIHMNPDGNLLPQPPNGDFGTAFRDLAASPPDRWQVETGTWKEGDPSAIYAKNDEQARSGRRAIYFGTDLSAMSLLSDFAPCIPEQIYAVEMWAKPSNTAQTPKLEIVWYDGNLTVISTSTLSRTPAAASYYLTPFNVQSPALARWYKVRTGKTSASANTVMVDDVRLRPVGDKWHDIGATGEPAFIGTWVNYDALTYSAAGFFRDQFGFVHLRGLIKSGTVGTAVFNLPIGYRPNRACHFPAASNAAFGWLRIDTATTGTAGDVVMGGGSNIWFDLGSAAPFMADL